MDGGTDQNIAPPAPPSSTRLLVKIVFVTSGRASANSLAV